MKQPLVSVEWLNQHLNDPDLILLNADHSSNVLNISPDHLNLQIPNSRNFDLKNVFRDKRSPLPNTLPGPKEFERECQHLGINASSKIVVYDHQGIYFSPRVWWMFKTMGHSQVSVLDGGFPAWVDKGLKTEPKITTQYPKGNFQVVFKGDLVRDINFVEEAIENPESVLIDVRSADRFYGRAPEPRKGLAGGHIENSINIPYKTVLNNGSYKNKEALSQIFKKAEIGERSLIFSCGSGITACIVFLACDLVAGNKKSIYDGSWTEWAEKNG